MTAYFFFTAPPVLCKPNIATSYQGCQRKQGRTRKTSGEFILAKERQEADRKRIEAKGISDFQTIVAAGISEQLLRWKGIEATEKLANSQNTKVIIVGAGKDGLPIIMDTK